jgi:hypothetical protein
LESFVARIEANPKHIHSQNWISGAHQNFKKLSTKRLAVVNIKPLAAPSTTSQMSHHPNIRTYMTTKRRERSASQLLQKQKAKDKRLRIQCALEQVSRQAERARRSSALVMGRDDVSSISGTNVLNMALGKMPFRM